MIRQISQLATVFQKKTVVECQLFSGRLHGFKLGRRCRLHWDKMNNKVYCFDFTHKGFKEILYQIDKAYRQMQYYQPLTQLIVCIAMCKVILNILLKYLTHLYIQLPGHTAILYKINNYNFLASYSYIAIIAIYP